MKNSKNAFTMIELIFVIVVLGILAGVAIPKMAATRDDAQIAKGRSDIASIRSAIVTERQTRLIKGDSAFITSLHDTSGSTYFDGNGSSTLLMYGIAPDSVKDGHWHSASTPTLVSGYYVTTYKFRVLGVDNTFTYTQADGKFDCNITGTSAPSCEQLTK